MIRTALCLALAVLVVPACSKKKEEGPAPSAGDTTPTPTPTTATKPTTATPPPAPADNAAPPPAADKVAGPVITTPKDLFAEFSEANKGDVMDRIDKYRPGATFSGVIKSGGASLTMDVDGKNRILMDFKDPASVKSVKSGDTVKATCQIAGEVGDLMQVNDCVLAK